MNKLTPEAVAAHAEAWPYANEPAGLWRFSRPGCMPRFYFVEVAPDLQTGFWVRRGSLAWSAKEVDTWEGGTWTPVRPDGSDLPPPSGEMWSKQMIRKNVVLLDRIRALEKERDAAREQGRSEERAAIVAGVEGVLEDLRAALSWTALGDGHALQAKEEATATLLYRLKAGEWSAKT